ncbi:MAG: YebC/PmpR family DNA-binding transcriptional regulator [Planctomycetota bacterium]
MAGHSHWSSIKHKKKKEDKRRGKLFSKLSKQIMSAVRRGGKDPETNLELQWAIEDAKDADMPKDNIERAILKGAGELEGQKVEAVRYEGYGSGGAAVMVDALTDNRNRTSAAVRKAFDKHGGKLGTNGCVDWMFETKGLIVIDADKMGEEELFELAVEAGVEEFEQAGDVYELTCPVDDFTDVRQVLEEKDIDFESAEITEVPRSYTDLEVSDARKVVAMMEELEDNDDVSKVHSNFNLPEELTEELQKAS